MPYKDREKQKLAMREIMKRYRKERIMAFQFIQEKGLMTDFTEYVKTKDKNKSE
jgi:hypothetical protein